MDENEFEGEMMCYQKDDNSCRRLRSKVRNFQGVNLAMMLLWQSVMRSGGTSLKSGLGGKQQRLNTHNISNSVYRPANWTFWYASQNHNCKGIDCKDSIPRFSGPI